MSVSRWVIGGLVAAGVVFAVVDYVVWRRAELGHYGQGASVAQPTPTPLPLAGLYQSDWAELRFSPPQEFAVDPVSRPENFLSSRPSGQRELVAKLAKGSIEIQIWVEKYNGNLIGAAEAEASLLPDLSRERQYLNTDQANAVILTWLQKDRTYQRALFAAKEKLVVIQATAPTSVWSSFEPTFWQIYRSVVIF